MLSTGSAKEDPSKHNRKIVDWEKESNQTNKNNEGKAHLANIKPFYHE